MGIGVMIFGGMLIVSLVWGVISYNGLVSRRNRMANAFAQIDVQLERRYDLIPNLVETAKAYLRHERETLEAVIQARNQAQSAARRAGLDPIDPGTIHALGQAEMRLDSAMGRFFALVEAYPDLKANANLMALQEELASTENRVAFARQAYNDVVTEYNTKRESLPDLFIAHLFGFKTAETLELQEPKARQAVRVSFT
jgi:LemA protein